MNSFFRPINPEQIGYMQDGIRRLTPREREVLLLVLEGLSNKQVARRLNVSHRTIDVHRSHMMEKLGARNAIELTRIVSILEHEKLGE